MHNFAVTIIFIHIIKAQDLWQLDDIKTLSEIPLNKLLEVKNTFQVEEYETQDVMAESRSDLPEALALKSKTQLNRGGYEENDKKGGSKSVQSIFQISVTTLAFLAFGGYLLCLIVQAINGKNMDMAGMNMNMNMMEMGEMMASIIRRPYVRPGRRTTRRPKRPVRKRRPNKRRPNPRQKREVWPNVDSESMYNALVMMSEAYVQYHTIDYKHYNYTRNSYL